MKLIIIDDEEAILYLLKNLLAELKPELEVETYEDLNSCKSSEDLSIILCDLSLSSGIADLSQLRKKYPKGHIYIHSGYAESYIEKVLEGSKEPWKHLSKPLELGKLVKEIEYVEKL